MAQKTPEERTTRELQKRTRVATMLLTVMVVVALIDAVVALAVGRYYLLWTAAGLLLMSVPMYAGRRKEVAELKRRGPE